MLFISLNYLNWTLIKLSLCNQKKRIFTGRFNKSLSLFENLQKYRYPPDFPQGPLPYLPHFEQLQSAFNLPLTNKIS